MNTRGWMELSLFVIALATITKPLGLYLVRVLDPKGATWLDRMVRPVERLTYRLMGVDAEREQDWKGYTLSLLWFSLAGCLFTYFLLRVQHRLPINPEGFGPLTPDLAFNTAISFMTNTNWQSYGGESTMSYLSQMVALTLHNFTSAATGIGVAAAVVRSLSRSSTRTIGNFWVDLVRVTYYLLLPGSLILAMLLVSQGVVQNFKPYVQSRGVEAAARPVQGGNGILESEANPSASDGLSEENRGAAGQRIVQGPMASQVAIKMYGTNGGGYSNANAAHPFENPTPLSNFVQMLAMFSIGSGLTYYLGRMTKNQAHGWSVWATMMVLFVVGVVACWRAEHLGNPIHQQLGVAVVDGNMEGKEVRFGIFDSTLFATITTAASCGAVNSMHDSFTPLGGLVLLFNMQLGEIIIGGVGAGLYGMLVFVVLAVFIAGLMVGRTPEYLGKKIGAYEVKLAMLSVLVLCLSILGFSSVAMCSEWGKAGMANAGPHGMSEVLYAFSSAIGNNGSAFAGLSANTPWYSTTLGVAMFLGRIGMIIPILALAGALGKKTVGASSSGTFPVHGGTFVILLLGTVILVGALSFLPVLALGPIAEHFHMVEGTLF